MTIVFWESLSWAWRFEMSRFNRKGQNEMVGFVLIVVLVMIALVVFMVISLRTDNDASESLAVENMISSVMRTSTECAIVFEPDYDNFEDLIRSCYGNKRCKNGEMACDYLNESLGEVMESVVATEATISGYRVSVFHKNEEEFDYLVDFYEGNCSSSLKGSQRAIATSSGSLVFRVEVC